MALVFSCDQGPAYKNKDLGVDQRVADLLKRMTPEEKFFQLLMVPFDADSIDGADYKNGMFGFQVSSSAMRGNNGNAILDYSSTEDQIAMVKKINRIQRHFVENTRLGIPVIFFDEALHGLVRKGATAFPQSIALAATFDTTLMSEVARAIAIETKARGIRQVLSPVVNIASDVRWGRTEETYGEDPLLVSLMGQNFVRAFENQNIIATPKHFVANVGDGGRDSYPIGLSERYLEEFHFPPFKAAINGGGARSIMTSYNSLGTEPNSQNDWLLREKLKGEWKFEGFVISDANAVGGANALHGTSDSYATSGKQAIESGLDVIFQTSFHHYGLYIPPFLNGSIDQRSIDEAVSRVLKAKFQLGLFDNPYADEAIAYDGGRHKELARLAAQEAMVLLKNTGVLPLKDRHKTVALIGRDAFEARLGGYSGPGNEKVNILQAMDSLFDEVLYVEGCGRSDNAPEVIETEYLAAGDGRKGLVGEYFDNTNLSGASVETRVDERINFSWTFMPPASKLNAHFYSVRWLGSIRAPKDGVYEIGLEGNDGFRLFLNDSLIIDHWQKQSYHRATKPFRFKKDQEYAVRIEFYESVGNGKIKLVWRLQPDDTERRIRDAVNTAMQSDVAIVVAGISEGEFQDRARISLPGSQVEMINRVADTGVPTVVVIVGGSAVTMSEWIDNVDAILYTWYPGEEGGWAVANTLAGLYNPGGKLPITFPRHEGQLPLSYNHLPTGRGDDYLNMTGRPLFPFGFGLSYTSFNYSGLAASKKTFKKDETITLAFKLTNKGSYGGDEVVQLYIKDIVSSVVVPVMQLKGFQRVHLEPGETKELTFLVTPSMLALLDQNLKEIVEPGKFRFMIGTSSNDIRLVMNLDVID